LEGHLISLNIPPTRKEEIMLAPYAWVGSYALWYMYVNIHDNFHVGLYDPMASTKREKWVKCDIELHVVAGCPTWFLKKRDYYTWIVINVLIVFIGKNCDVVVRTHALSLKVQGLILFVIFFSWTNEKEDKSLDPLLQASCVKKRSCNYFPKVRTWKPQPSCVRKICKSRLGKHFVLIILLCVFDFHPYYATFHNENLKKIVA